MRRSLSPLLSHKRLPSDDSVPGDKKKPYVQAVLDLPCEESDLDELTLHELRGIFLACCSDSDARLTLGQLRQALAMTGICVNAAYIQRSLATEKAAEDRNDDPRSSRFTFAQFARLVATELSKPSRGSLSMSDMKELMQIFDADGTGLISADDFRHIMMRTSSPGCFTPAAMQQLERLIPATCVVSDEDNNDITAPPPASDVDALGLGFGAMDRIKEQIARSREKREAQQGLDGKSVDYEAWLQTMRLQPRRARKAVY